MRVIEVEKCSDCPVSHWHSLYDEWLCEHPDVDPVVVDVSTVPGWCPLRRETLTARFVGEARRSEED